MERDDNNRIAKMGKKLATAYLNRLRSKNVYHKPWNTTLPIEQTQVWKHFVLAGEVAVEMEADPNHYIAAQFDGLKWAGRGRFPFPSQLHTDGARLRYISFMEARGAREEKLAKPEHAVVDTTTREEKKLVALKRRFGIKKRAVLRQMPGEFSEAVHRKYGTWDDVKDEVLS